MKTKQFWELYSSHDCSIATRFATSEILRHSYRPFPPISYHPTNYSTGPNKFMYLQVHLDEYVKVSEGMYKGIYEYDVKKKEILRVPWLVKNPSFYSGKPLWFTNDSRVFPLKPIESSEKEEEKGKAG